MKIFFLRLSLILCWISCQLIFKASASTQTVRNDEQCRSFFSSKELSELTSYLRLLNNQTPAWSKFDLTSNTILIVNRIEEGSCYVIWSDKKVLFQFFSEERTELLTPIYWFYYNSEKKYIPDYMKGLADLMRPFPSELKKFFDSQNLKKALIFNFNFPMPLEDSPERDSFDSVFNSKNAFRVSMIAHEGFHLYGQFPRWFNQPGSSEVWPEWDIQPNRKALVQNCYGQDNGFTKDEKRELLNAFRSLYVKKNESLARRHLGEYVKFRNSRYKDLENISIHKANGQKTSCKNAESIMEFEEGFADFVGLSTSASINLISSEQIFINYLTSKQQDFYLFGSLQLFILKALAPKSFDEIIGNLVQSDQVGEGIFGSIRRLIKNK